MSDSTVYDTLARSSLARELENTFTEATGLPVELVPPGEPRMLFTFQASGSPFCSLMAQFAGSCLACQKAHLELQERILNDLSHQVTYCFAGLSEFAVPVMVGEEHVATLWGGQVFQHQPTRAQFRRLRHQLRLWGMQNDLRRIETAFFQTRVISRKQFQASLRLLTIFARFLAEDANRDLLIAQINEQPCITEAKSFILAHAGEPLRLSDVAQHLHISVQYFSKFFKKTAGVGFSEFLTRLRVENAKRLLANPGLLIHEVANEAGFGSLSQFNRVFRRYTGCSPKEYRASLRQNHPSESTPPNSLKYA
jgi:AraC-like DNA-binding protein